MERTGLEAVMNDSDFLTGVDKIIAATKRMESQQVNTSQKLESLDVQRKAAAKEQAAEEEAKYDRMRAAMAEYQKKVDATLSLQKQKTDALAAAEKERARKFGGIVSGIKDHYSDITSFARDARDAMIKAWDFAKEGAELDLAERKFGILATRLNSTADVMLGKLKNATQGMMSDAKLMQTAGDVMSLGLVKTEDQAVRLTGAISALGADMNQVVLTLSNQTTMRFDQIGIAVDGFDEKLKALEATGMSTNEAFTEAFLQQAEQQVATLGGVAETTAGQMMILESTFENLKNEAKMSAAEGLGPLVVKINESREAVRTLNELYDLGIISTAEYAKNQALLRTPLSDTDAILEDLNSQLDDYIYLAESSTTETKFLDETNQDLATGFRETVEVFDYSIQQQEWYRKSLEETTEAQDDLGDSTEETAHKVGSLNTALQNQITSLRDQIEFLSAGGGVLLSAIEAIQSAVNEGKLAYDEGAAALQDVGVAAVDLDLELGKIDPEQAVERLMELGYGPEEAKDLVKKLQDSLYALTSQEWVINITTNVEGGTGPTSKSQTGSDQSGKGTTGGHKGETEQLSGPGYAITIPIVPVFSDEWDQVPGDLLSIGKWSGEEFGSGMVDGIQPPLEELHEDFAEVGEDLGQQLIERVGVEYKEMLKDMRGDISGLSRTLKEMIKESQNLEGSELEAMKERIKEIREKLKDMRGDLDDMKGTLVNMLLEAGDAMSGILSGFGRMYEDETVRPIEDRLKLQEDELESVNDLIAAKKEQYYGEISEMEYAQLRLQFQRDASSLTEKERNQLIFLGSLEEKRNLLMRDRKATAEELAAEEERMLELQKQQEQLKFLQQQMDMIDFIREHGLDPTEVLGGMKLGIDASLPDLIDAMSHAMQEIINAANEELEIGSPSKVMQDIAENLMVTLGSTISTNMAYPMEAMKGAMAGVTSMAMAPSNAPLSYTNYNRTANLNFGDTILSGGMDIAAMELMLKSLLKRELGV